MGDDSGVIGGWAKPHMEVIKQQKGLKRNRDELDQAEPDNNGSTKRHDHNQGKNATITPGTPPVITRRNPSEYEDSLNITANIEGGSSVNQKKTAPKAHLESIPKFPTAEVEKESERTMFEKVKELIIMDLSMEEGIAEAINLLDNSGKLISLDLKLNKMVMKALLQARQVQQVMKMAKEHQNNLRSALVELLSSGLL